jgi:hypothetical protein
MTRLMNAARRSGRWCGAHPDGPRRVALRAGFILFFLGSIAIPANADPAIVETVAAGALGLTSILVPLALESLAVVLLLRPFGFRGLRLFFVWLGLTSATFAGLVALVAFIQNLLGGRRLGWTLAAGEAAVVAVEMGLLLAISRWSFLRREPRKRITALQAFVVSLAANVVSVLAGFLFLAVATWMLDKFFSG